MQLVGQQTVLWDGALKGAIWAEAPHLYKVDGWHYLLIAEGGTAHHHAVTIARSRNVEGPYAANPGNPILTHRHLGLDYPIVGAGHGDLVQTQTGEWWMALLAMRPYGGYFYNLGRETFLVPVRWEDGWPVMSPGTGRVEMSYPAPVQTAMILMGRSSHHIGISCARRVTTSGAYPSGPDTCGCACAPSSCQNGPRRVLSGGGSSTSIFEPRLRSNSDRTRSTNAPVLPWCRTMTSTFYLS
jgi:hypothetical protein